MKTNKNIQSIITSQGQIHNKMATNKNSLGQSRFLDIVRQFIQLANTCKCKPLKYLHQGYGFTLVKTPQSLVQLNKITTDCLDISFKQLQKQLHQFGFKIKNKKLSQDDSFKTKYKFTEPFIMSKPAVMAMDDSQSEALKLDQDENMDDFPKDEQIEQIMKVKQDRSKGPSKLYQKIKAQSEGMLGISQKKRNLDDASIEVKLFQQDLFSTPLPTNRKLNSDLQQISEQQNQRSVSLVERNNLYKENYQKCSRLIDNTMMEILTAHRKKKVGEKAEELLSKVIEIYDILSDNIENVNETVRQFEKKDDRRQNNFSPTFKPLNGANDYSK